VALGRGLSVLIHPADVAAVADGVLVNAVWAVGRMVARPRESRRTAADLDAAQWADSGPFVLEVLKVSSNESAALNKSAAAAIGRYLADHSSLPWIKGSLPMEMVSVADLDEDYYFNQLVGRIQLTAVDEMESLGIAASACMGYELLGHRWSFAGPRPDSPVLFGYIANRSNSADYELGDLTVPDEFKKVFRDWAAGQVNFVDLATE
jgi:hypothetical protein